MHNYRYTQVLSTLDCGAPKYTPSYMLQNWVRIQRSESGPKAKKFLPECSFRRSRKRNGGWNFGAGMVGQSVYFLPESSYFVSGNIATKIFNR